MKKAVVIFDRVRDCPHYCQPECNHLDGNGECNENELATPPKDCPLEDE